MMGEERDSFIHLLIPLFNKYLLSFYKMMDRQGSECGKSQTGMGTHKENSREF